MMSQDDTVDQPERRDFFISYTGTDRQWAEWIAMQLEEAGYTLFIQAWDFRPGSNFVAEMDQAARCADRTMLVLSPSYLLSEYAFAEWATAFRRDPKGMKKRVLPVRIQPCEVDGLLGSIVYIDLASLEEAAARERLLAGVQQERAKPATVAFPGHNILHELHAFAVFPGSLPAIWNIPYPRNPFFTGREQELEQLHAQLQQSNTTAIGQTQTISGLGGIGKTQLAVEYTYRYRQEYQTVLWAHADTTEALNSSYTELAHLLELPEKEAQEQAIIVRAVKNWLRTHQSWLLILDNADEPDVLVPFMPEVVGGHLLITTRSSAVRRLNIANPLALETLTSEQGVLFLLHRAGLLALNVPLAQASLEDQTLAQHISQELGGLPLAIEQAAAYIETTSTSLIAYRSLYQQHRAELLKRGQPLHYPHTVATTWNISFQRVEATNIAAADLLRFCAFLAPDAIPEEILTEGASELGPVLAPVAADALLLNDAIAVLRAYSLISRDSYARLLTIHRLVQAVLRDNMLAETWQHWMQRAVHAVAVAYPDPDFVNWPILERLLPHALRCATWIEQASLVTPTAAFLLNRAGYYLNDRARYSEAEPLYQRALAICEQELGATHPDTANGLNNLAGLYKDQGRYEEAEPLLKRALAIQEQELGATHPDTAKSLGNLAELYREQGRYREVEPLYQRALAIQEQELGATHPDTTTSLNNLAIFYHQQGRYEEAEPLYERALVICEQELGATHPDTALSLGNLAELYREQGKYEQAEPLYQRTLAIQEQELGATHPTTANSLNNLGILYYEQGKYEQAEPLYRRALAIREQELGATHPDIALSLNNLAELYREQGKYEEAEPLYQRALAICEQKLVATHPTTATSLNNLGILYYEQGRYEEAEPLLKRALAIRKLVLGATHLNTAKSLSNLASLYDSQERYEEAEPLYQRALAICEQELGATHPTTATSLNNLASLYYAQRRYREAELLFKRALTIWARELGGAHPLTATGLNNLAELYMKQEKYEEAEPLYRHALAIWESTLGRQHPNTQTLRKNYATLLRTIGRDEETRRLEEKP